MNKLSTSSKSQLATCHPILQSCVMYALEVIDVGVTSGHRDAELQQQYFTLGKSQVEFPNSKHNLEVSEAADLVIWVKEFGYLWSPLACYHGSEYFYMQYARLDTLMQIKAKELGYSLRWGGKWNRPYDLLDNTLIDVFHWELGEKL